MDSWHNGVMALPGDTFAWVDESIIQPSDGRNGYYVLAAAVHSSASADNIRESLRYLLVGKSKRLHWREESNERRKKLADAVSNLNATFILVVGSPITPAKLERARRLCLEVLISELDNQGVSYVGVERRTPKQNRQDIALIDSLRSKHRIGRGIRVEFADPNQEPLVWMPDIVAGVFVTSKLSKKVQLEHECDNLRIIEIYW